MDLTLITPTLLNLYDPAIKKTLACQLFANEKPPAPAAPRSGYLRF